MREIMPLTKNNEINNMIKRGVVTASLCRPIKPPLARLKPGSRHSFAVPSG
jgi:hypothetical protein